jgi:hypothetical protein
MNITQSPNTQSKMIKDFLQWENDNCSPKCSNPDCHRPDRGGSCGLCGEHMQKRLNTQSKEVWLPTTN